MTRTDSANGSERLGNGTEGTERDPARSFFPDRVGPYDLVRRINVGGMGIVYEAIRRHPRQVVAIKLLKDVFGTDAQRRRFDAEIRFLAILNHPNIAKVFDAGIEETESGGLPYLAMEYIDGALPITEYATKLQLSVRDRIKLFVDVCDAVAHGHGKNILHRDLKPANIVVDSHGIAKVIDFGVAKAIDGQDPANSPRTLTGEIVGTAQYMSPEQLCSDSATLDARSDVFSLGVVLYELLTEELPYRVEHQTPMATTRALLNTIPHLPSHSRKSIPRDLDGILLKSIAKRRNERYQSASELRADLLRFLNNEPIENAAPTSFYRSRHIVRRLISHQTVLSLLIAIALSFSVTEFLGVPLVYNWLPIQHTYMNWLSSQTWLKSSTAGLENVRIIRVTDTTVELAPSLAEEAGVTAFDAENWQSMRALYARLMTRLVDSGARAVAIDFYFISESPFDEMLVEGLRDVRSAGIPAIVAAQHWCIEDDERLPVIESVGSVAQFGCASVTSSDEVEVVLDRRNGPMSASFALTAAIAYWHPNWQFTTSFDPIDDSVVQIDCFELSHVESAKLSGRSESRRITLTSNSASDFDDPDFCVRTGDFSGYYSFPLPSAKTFEESSVNLESVFRTDVSALSNVFAGKLVIIGDYRNGKDVHQTADGHEIYGCSVNAAAIDAILNQTVILKERSWYSRAAILVLALIGTLLGILFAGRPWYRCFLLTGIAAALFIAALLSYRELLYIFNPLLPFTAALIGCELVAKIISTHRTYRL